MKYIIGAVIAIIIFIAGVIIGGKYYAKTEIVVKKEIVYETKWKYKELKKEASPIFDQENFDRLLNCYDSPLRFGYNIQNNEILVKAWDDCKEGEVKYEIGTSGNYKIYIAVGLVGIGSGLLLYHFLK